MTINGTGVAGDTVTVYDGSTVVGTDDRRHERHLAAEARRMASGSHTLTATQTLVAGVTSNASAAVTVTVPAH